MEWKAWEAKIDEECAENIKAVLESEQEQFGPTLQCLDGMKEDIKAKGLEIRRMEKIVQALERKAFELEDEAESVHVVEKQERDDIMEEKRNVMKERAKMLRGIKKAMTERENDIKEREKILEKRGQLWEWVKEMEGLW